MGMGLYSRYWILFLFLTRSDELIRFYVLCFILLFDSSRGL